ncbi:MAG: prephenate dehydrogenase, partial [Clostridia bacterium]|nr:prephenate dehydrogenase [Clostridia bacterium]
MKIGIVGLGLMGGSFGRTLIKKTDNVVYGYDINPQTMLKGEMLNAYSEKLTTKNAGELDMLIIAVYPDYFASALNEFLPHLRKGAVVIDFCGVKRPIIEEMQKALTLRPDIIFIGGHPMAGREFSGIERSVTTLFDKASMILVPVNADIFTLDGVKKFFLGLGFSEVVITTYENHDKMIAYTSQLCHIVSNAFIKNQTAKEHFGYSAGSYKDLTRVARLNPFMWSGLMTANSNLLASELDELIENLQKYSKALKEKD